MSYILLQDYYRQIQQLQLQQLITNSSTVLTQAENAAIAEVKSYLVQKYEIAKEFTDTSVWNYASAYKANSRVYLDASAYSSSSTYALNTLTLQSGNVYICTTAINTPEAFNAAHWTLLGAQYTIFYAQYPKPVFNQYSVYSVNDQVFYNDHTYKALIATNIPDQFTALQYESYSNIPNYNVYPDDPVNGAIYWQDLGAYSVAASTLPTNTAYWTEGDNRNQQVLLYVIDIVLYHLLSRISPQNVSELRQNRYDDAKDFLKRAAKGTDVTLDLPVIQPKQGRSIRWGGDVKENNIY